MTNTLELLAKSPLASLWPNLPPLTDSVDPFSFSQRMALYRLLIEASNAHGLFGDDNLLNIFWGYTFQLHWQWRSGRYRAEDEQADDYLHPNSMWGYGNYSLCVIPYVAAVQEGLAPPLTIKSAPASSLVSYASGGGDGQPFAVPPVFVEAVAEWRRFFAFLASLRVGDDVEPVRFRLWRAHGASLEASAIDTPTLYPGQSKLEQEFLSGWVRMVDFLGAAAWRTDIEFMLVNGLDVLPERVLTDADVPGQVPDMDKQVNTNLKSIFGLVRQPPRRFAFNLWLWKRAMRTRPARDEVLEMLGAQFDPKPENAAARRKLLRYTLAL